MSTVNKKIGEKSKAHTVYKTKEGKRVPSVTTILNVINKPALIAWANNLGLEGKNAEEYKRETASIGTLGHELIQEELGGFEVDLDMYSSDQIVAANVALEHFHEWQNDIDSSIETYHIELPMVHETLMYGGKIDWYCKMNDEMWLIDIKTSGGLYSEMEAQVAAYAELLDHYGYKVDKVALLNVSREEEVSYKFLELKPERLGKAWGVFEAALNLYKAQSAHNKERN